MGFNKYLLIATLILILSMSILNCTKDSNSGINADYFQHYHANIINPNGASLSKIKSDLINRIKNHKIKYSGIYFLDSNRVIVQIGGVSSKDYYIDIFNEKDGVKYKVLAFTQLKGVIGFNISKGSYYIVLESNLKNTIGTIENKLGLTNMSYIQQLNEPLNGPTPYHIWYSNDDINGESNNIEDMRTLIKKKLGPNNKMKILFVEKIVN